jgi:hypothetical protein
MKEKQLQPVTFGQAKRLKAAGFNWETVEFYHSDGTADRYICCGHNTNGGFSAPTVALALKCFRDEKKIDNAVNFFDVTLPRYTGVYQVPRIMDAGKRRLSPRTVYHTFTQKDYESAGSALLDELLIILEKEIRK